MLIEQDQSGHNKLNMTEVDTNWHRTEVDTNWTVVDKIGPKWTK